MIGLSIAIAGGVVLTARRRSASHDERTRSAGGHRRERPTSASTSSTAHDDEFAARIGRLPGVEDYAQIEVWADGHARSSDAEIPIVAAVDDASAAPSTAASSYAADVPRPRTRWRSPRTWPAARISTVGSQSALRHVRAATSSMRCGAAVAVPRPAGPDDHAAGRRDRSAGRRSLHPGRADRNPVPRRADVSQVRRPGADLHRHCPGPRRGRGG